jgi:hypothetical protein
MGWVVNATPRLPYPPGKTPGTHYIGGWVGPRARLDRCEKSRLLDPRTVQPVASHYTN